LPGAASVTLRVVKELIERHGLVPHPEGGWYRETYRAARTLPGTQRSVCTAILYLLAAGQRSRLHRIDADELWHFHRGDPLHVVELVRDARPRVHVLSIDAPQVLVPAGAWFGAMPAPGSQWTLCGCTVSPGFEFSTFELGETARLLAEFPLATTEILALQST
jgi:predicted cupin superfamily sugar epimerase